MEVVQQRVSPGVAPLYATLKFIVWAQEMADSIDGTQRLGPDLAGLNNFPEIVSAVALYWSLAQEDAQKRRMILSLIGMCWI